LIIFKEESEVGDEEEEPNEEEEYYEPLQRNRAPVVIEANKSNITQNVEGDISGGDELLNVISSDDENLQTSQPAITLRLPTGNININNNIIKTPTPKQ